MVAGVYNAMVGLQQKAAGASTLAKSTAKAIQHFDQVFYTWGLWRQ